jgi:hypothetical protein
MCILLKLDVLKRLCVYPENLVMITSDGWNAQKNLKTFILKSSRF